MPFRPPSSSTPLVGLVVAALALAGCSSSNPKPISTTTTTSSASTTTSTSPTGVPQPTTTSTTAVSAGGPLPKGITVVDMTWTSNSEGWALGTAPCSHPPCTSVVHTLDGGRTWAGLPAPIAFLPSGPASPALVGCSPTLACVDGIRFADANTGYAFGASSLWLTTNGGHTWSQKGSEATDALEITQGKVVRVTHSALGCPPGCPYLVQSSPVGATTWTALPVPAVQGVSAALTVDGAHLYVAAFGHIAGGAGDAHTQFARSTDNGAHWTGFADPCGTTTSGKEADATAMSAAAGGFLVVGCSPRGPGNSFVVVSANAGATFGPHQDNLVPVSASDGDHVVQIAAATGQRLAALVASNANLSISVTNDAAVDWTVTHSEPTPNLGPSHPYLGFQDLTTGRAVLTPNTVLTTTDGGGHWTPFAFP